MRTGIQHATHTAEFDTIDRTLERLFKDVRHIGERRPAMFPVTAEPLKAIRER